MDGCMATKTDVSKNHYDFRVAAPSFIYPAGYVANAKKLAPLLDEIELLLFESAPESLPTRRQIDELTAIARDTGISYNVHLPLDIDLSLPDKSRRDHSVSLLADIIDHVKPLAPTTHTLHLICKERSDDPSSVNRWQELAAEGLSTLLRRISIPARDISVETLDYPPIWLKPFIDNYGVSVCLDIGHVIRYGYNLEETWQTFSQRTTIIHLHGVVEGKDHRALDRLHKKHWDTTARILGQFRESLSLEVFSPERLIRSLSFLPELIRSHNPMDSRE